MFDFYGNYTVGYDFHGNPLESDDKIRIKLITDTHVRLTREDARNLLNSNFASMNWSRYSAFLNLGDDCNNVDESCLMASRDAVASVPIGKQIRIAGNHDVWRNGDSGTRICTNAEYEQMRNVYYNNSAYGTDYHYYGMGLETGVDSSHDVRYVVATGWDDSKAGTTNYKWNITSKMMDDIITMLSKDDHDLIWLSHIQPFGGNFDTVKPAVDGNEQTTESYTPMRLNCMDYVVNLNQLIADRKHKRAGSITDGSGVSHPYDFTRCTTDLLCCLCGHDHVDRYWYVDGVPVILLDAYAYDDHPVYDLVIDRDSMSMDVTKKGDTQTYNYQIDLNV